MTADFPGASMNTANANWDARKTELELPEEIDLQVELANVGSRTLAMLVDLSLGGLILFTVYALSTLLGRNMVDDWLTRVSSNTVSIISMLLFLALQWGYFNLFEWLWNGQTPGKRLLRLRVIKVDGSPVSAVDVLLRNFSRPVDTFGPLVFASFLMIFLTRKAQRLGDLMARTLVIHETRIDWSIFDQLEQPAAGAGVPAPPAAPAVRLSSAQWELLHRFLNRRGQLQPEARQRLAQSLYETLKPAVHGTELALSTLPPEDWLAELARRT